MKKKSAIIRQSLLNKITLIPIKKRGLCLIIVLLSQFQYGYSQEQANCFEPTAQTHLDIGKVSTIMLNAGDMWWDLTQAVYEVPKGSGKHSIFNGGLWLGAIDDEDNLKVAAQKFRQGGSDFWAGPINNQRLIMDGENQVENPNYGTTTEEVCSYYDRHFEVNRNEVLDFIAYNNSTNPEAEFPNYTIPASIIDYPGNRIHDNSENVFTGEDSIVQTNPYYNLEVLAPFRDVDGDQFYNPLAGDYPEFNLDNSIDCSSGNFLSGDQNLWYVFNDVGNTHGESGSVMAMGLEIQAQAYAFAETEIDAIDYTTFYNYKLINRSHQALNEMYFGVNVDADLGDYQDDYVGSNIERGLGYTYNGDEDDGSAVGYGANPPAIGLDFLQGPLADENDGIDNNRDGTIDEAGERIIMSNFLYYNNDHSVTGFPQSPQGYYNYLKSIWKDNLQLTSCGDGRNQENPITNFMFADDETNENCSPWLEQSAGNVPADRRFVQSVGAFTMEPGAIKNITTALIWSRTDTAGARGSVEKLMVDDDYIQDLFDNCFEMPCIEPNATLANYTVLTENYGLAMEYPIQFNIPISMIVGNNTQVLWDFNDGNTSNMSSPVHHYQNPGDYTVYITLTNDCGQDTYLLNIHVPYILHSSSAVGVQIERIEGIGSAGRALELTEESYEYIRDNFEKQKIKYKQNYGPFIIHINDTNEVTEGSYELRRLYENEEDNEFTWLLKHLNTEVTELITTTTGIKESIELNNWGFDIQINQVIDIGDDLSVNNGFIDSYMTESNWLTYIYDSDKLWIIDDSIKISPYNWIRSGTDKIALDDPWSPTLIDMGNSGFNGNWEDENEVFENVINGAWAPYRLVGYTKENIPFEHSPSIGRGEKLNKLNSVDIVYTSDKSLWTRVPVIETGNSENRMKLKTNPSVDKYGTPDNTGTGFSWFPGYAIDLEKGIRLNMMFGEATDLVAHNGNDMMWNPSSVELEGDSNDPVYEQDVIFGGRHYLYVTYSKYEGNDETQHPFYTRLLDMSSFVNQKKVFEDIAWVSLSMLKPDAELLSDEVKEKIRVSKPFDHYTFNNSLNVEYQNEGNPLYNFSINTDSLEVSINELIKQTSGILVQTINLLGQEVDVHNLLAGTIYIELYDNGLVHKKIKR